MRLGYTIMLGASAINLVIALLLPEPRVPWSVLPIGLHAIGIGINFPTLTLLLLDRFPHHRGAVSSVQAFVSLVISATLAGAISPLVSGSAICACDDRRDRDDARLRELARLSLDRDTRRPRAASGSGLSSGSSRRQRAVQHSVGK